MFSEISIRTEVNYLHKMDITTFIVELDGSDCPIQDRPLLNGALQELDSLIGMVDVKRAVIDQLLFLLSNIKAKGVKNATDSHLLHTLVVGKAGVGKSRIGAILAKIWSSLGILGHNDSEQASQPDSLTAKLFRDNINLNLVNKVILERIERAETASEATRLKIRELRKNIFALRSKGRQRHPNSSAEEVKTEVDDSIKRMARISSDALNYSSMTCQTLANQPIAEPSAIIFSPGEMVPPPLSIAIPCTPMPPTPPPASKFKVVSRINFVAEYVGQTAVKTRKLLEDHKGGVLFVDEAYSLYHGDRDSFGSEALTVINQYMTENSDSTVLIFAGYKDMMQSTIFKAQPGLARRFAFTFEIPGYSAEELADIFLLQLKADGWQFEDRPNLIEFFTTHHASFPSFGGDTKRLIFQCKLLYTAQHWKDTEATRKLTREILNDALNKYKLHQPLDIDRLKMLEAQRTYEDDLLQLRIREHQEHKDNSQLYDQFRASERDQIAQKIKENNNRKIHGDLYDRYREFELAQMQQRIREQKERDSNLELYDNFRGFERYQMEQRIREQAERKAHEELYTAGKQLERDELDRKIKESAERKKIDNREPPQSMYS
jgi:hypothetical protein